MNENLKPKEKREQIATIYIADRLPMGLKSVQDIKLLDYVINGSIVSAYEYDRSATTALRLLQKNLGGTLLEVLEVTPNWEIKDGLMEPEYYKKLEIKFEQWSPYGSETGDFWNNGEPGRKSFKISNAHLQRYVEKLHDFNIMKVLKEGSSYIVGYGRDVTLETMQLVKELTK